MFETLKRRVRSSRRHRELTKLLAQRPARPRDRELGLAIHQAIRSGARFRKPLVNEPFSREGSGALVIMEASVDQEVLSEYLQAIPHRDAYIQAAPPPGSANAIPLTPAPSLVSRGTLDDTHLARTTETFVAEICGALARHMPQEGRIIGGVDTLDVLDFHLGDRMHTIGRIVRGLVDRISSGEYSSVIFLVANHQLWRALDPVAQKAVGSDNVHVFWLPKQSAEPAEPNNPPAAPVPDATDPGPPPSTDVVLLVEPQPRLTREMSRVAKEVAKNHHVTAITPVERLSWHLGHANHLAALADEHPDRVSFVCPDRAVPVDLPVDVALRDAIWNDPVIKALKLDGVNLHSLIKPLLHTTLHEWATTKQFATGFHAYLQASRPKLLVVCPDRSPQARAACRLARVHGVTSYYPVPGMLSAYPRYKELQADFGSLMDDSQIEIHVRARPADEGRMFAEGVTNLDEATNAWLKTGGRMPEQACVALILQPMTATYNAAVIQLVGEALDGVDADLIVRSHPSESTGANQRYAELVANLPRASLDEGPLPDLLERATLVVGAFSAVLIEAAIVGRPVLSINLTKDPFPVPVGEMGIATEVYDRDSARAAVHDLLVDPETIAAAARRQQEYFERNPHLRARPASVGIAQRIDTLVRSTSAAGRD